MSKNKAHPLKTLDEIGMHMEKIICMRCNKEKPAKDAFKFHALFVCRECKIELDKLNDKSDEL